MISEYEIKKVFLFFLLFNTKCLEELGQRDTMCLGSFADRFAPGDRAPYATHAKFEECLGCLRFCLKKIENGTVSGNLRHSIT